MTPEALQLFTKLPDGRRACCYLPSPSPSPPLAPSCPALRPSPPNLDLAVPGATPTRRATMFLPDLFLPTSPEHLPYGLLGFGLAAWRLADSSLLCCPRANVARGAHSSACVRAGLERRGSAMRACPSLSSLCMARGRSCLLGPQTADPSREVIVLASITIGVVFPGPIHSIYRTMFECRDSLVVKQYVLQRCVLEPAYVRRLLPLSSVSSADLCKCPGADNGKLVIMSPDRFEQIR